MTTPGHPRPNIVMVLTDDHAAQAISAYGSGLNHTPRIDGIAAEGWRFDNCFVTNSLCSPSRASILTGTYSHVNGVTTLVTPIDAAQPTFVSQLKAAGYRTAMIGKWHMGDGPGHDPQHFDYWDVFIEQGEYRPWIPPAAVDRAPVPLPATFFDDYATRSSSVRRAAMRIAEHLTLEDLKEPPPPGLSYEDEAMWKFQRFMQDYLAVVRSVDDNVGRVVDWLRERDLFAETLFMYASDQGFFLGEHGWFDKRLMFEESLRMPLVLSYPRRLPAGRVFTDMVTNVDGAQTILDAAGVAHHPRMQGRSFWPDLLDAPVEPPVTGVHYRYWEHDDVFHKAPAHYGYRTDRYKIIYYYNDGLGIPGTGSGTYPPEWELYDLRADPAEVRNVYHDPAYLAVRAELTAAMWREQARLHDEPHPSQPRPPGV